MELLTPAAGLIVWTTVAFLILMLLLKKFAWKPILDAVMEREAGIEKSLHEAERARKEFESLKADNEKLLQEAREERAKIIKEAREAGDRLIQEARQKSSDEFSKKVAEASREIDARKEAAKAELKAQAGMLAVDLARKVLQRELSDAKAHETYANQLADEIQLN